MKNKRKIYSLATAAVAICILTATPIYADASYTISSGSMSSSSESSNEIVPGIPDIWDIFDTLPTDSGSVSYLIDFYDPDGRFLDSKICHYGDRLENVIVPETKEDDQYIYQFSGWDPQLPEMVTESMMFTAVYQKIDKPSSHEDPHIPAGPTTDDDATTPGPSAEETREQITKTSSDAGSSTGKTQVSATSYDVTSFHIETPAAPKTETPLIPEEIPAPGGPTPTADPDAASGRDTRKSESGQQTPGASTPAQDPNTINAVGPAIGTPVPTATAIPTGTVTPEGSSTRADAGKTPSALPAATAPKTAAKTKTRHTRSVKKEEKAPAQETTARSAKTTDQKEQKLSSNAARYSAMAPAPVSEEDKEKPLLPTLLVGLAVCGGTLFFENKKIRHMR